MERSESTAMLVARFLAAMPFVVSAAGKIAEPAATVAHIAQSGLPLPSVWFALGTIVELSGSLALLIGFQPRIAASALALFCMVAAVFFHANFHDFDQAINFMKNLAMAGGLIYFAARGMRGPAGAAALVAARILASFLFLWDGWSQAGLHAGTVAYIAKAGLPAPELAYWLSLAAEWGGGLGLLLGLGTRWAAAGLALFCLATAALFHADFADVANMIHFVKNVAMAGGFLAVFATGGGRWSLDRLIGWRLSPA